MSGEDPEGFLGRWSRIKRTAARAQPEPEPESPPEPDLPESDPEPEGVAKADPPTLSEEELAALPRIEDLVQGSDIRAFLRPGVPRALKNAALRRMWMLTPAIRDYRDPAVDYAWDWNTPGGVPGDGVAPSPERTAQMLRSLLSPKADKAGAEMAKEIVADADDAPDASGDDTSTKATPVAPTSGPQASERGSEEAGPGAPDSVAEPDPPVRRRHGSALPE